MYGQTIAKIHEFSKVQLEYDIRGYKEKSDHGSKLPLGLYLCSFSISPGEMENINIVILIH